MGLLDYGSVKRTKFQTFLGNGFKSNNFYVEISFPKALSVIRNRLGSGNHIFNKMVATAPIKFANLPWYLMFKGGSTILKGGTPVIDGLITKIQIPGYEVSTISDTFPYIQRISKGTFNANGLTLDFINDQFNVQWIWWRNYLAYNTLYRVQYPEDYECDISVYLQSNRKNDYYKITFKSCLLNKIPDMDLGYANSGTTSFKLDFSFEDMKIRPNLFTTDDILELIT